MKKTREKVVLMSVSCWEERGKSKLVRRWTNIKLAKKTFHF